MKTTKRIFALLTAVILCLAPMALMVGAAQNDEISLYGSPNYTCICGESRVYRSLTNAVLIEKEIVKSQSVCCIDWYNNVEYICTSCNVVKDRDDGVGIQRSHPTFHQNTANGRYYCTQCGIEKTW